MYNILITGASGMIGMEVAYSLLRKGYNVIGTDRQPNEFVRRENYSFVQAYITDKEKITKIFDTQKIDIVIHLANSVDNDIATTLTEQEVEDSKICDKYFWKAIARMNIKAVLLLSTTQVYSNFKCREPIREAASLKPYSAYGRMKLDSEIAMDAALKKVGVNAISMRVAPIYKSNFTQNLRDRVYDVKDDAGVIYGNGDYGFCFCCIYNLVGFINAIVNEKRRGYEGPYNICDNALIQARDILERERAEHRIGVVMQKPLGGVLKSLLVPSKRVKYDYRYVDLNSIANNIMYDNTKAKRFYTFRWNFNNTK